jgi:hypothetical protein
VIDHLVGAELTGQLDARARCRSDQMRPAPLRGLDGETADTSGRSINQHPLALGELAVVAKALPPAERGERYGGALDVAECSAYRGRQFGR